MGTLTFLSQYSFWTIALIVAAILIVGEKIIHWCKDTWKKREEFKQQYVQKGREIERQEEHQDDRFVNGEARMTQLEKDVGDLKTIIQKQQELIELLIKSDELDIKSWIKAQHERWIPLGCIDSQTLELLEQRFAVYTKEGGNSWAEKLVKELRALPTVVNLPITEIHDITHSRDE